MVHCQYHVDFLHLTVRDSVRTSKVEQQLMGWIDPSFDPCFLMCECFFFLLKVLPDSIFEGYAILDGCYGYWDPDGDYNEAHDSVLSQIGGYLQQIEIRYNERSSALIDELLRLLTVRTRGSIHWALNSESVMELPYDFLSWALVEGLSLLC